MQTTSTSTTTSTKEAIRANRKEFIEKTASLKLSSGVKMGALLIHGLTGMPNEMQPIARVLEALGCQVSVPMLAGHGASQKELLSTGWKDWLGSARDALTELCKTCDTVVVGGLSMGGPLSVILATENSKVGGIVALSPTIKYDSKNSSNPFQILLPLLDVVPFLGKYFYWTEQPPFGLKDERLQRKIIKELEAVKTAHKQQAKSLGLGESNDGDYSSTHNFNPEQFRTYSISLRQLQKLIKEVRKQAPHVKCPALIIHSVEDTITTKWNAETLHSWLGTQDKEIFFLEGCDHVLTMDLKKEEVAYRYTQFVCKVAAAYKSN